MGRGTSARPGFAVLRWGKVQAAFGGVTTNPASDPPLLLQGNCYVWNLTGGIGEEVTQLIPKTKIPAHNRYALQCKFSPDSTCVPASPSPTCHGNRRGVQGHQMCPSCWQTRCPAGPRGRSGTGDTLGLGCWQQHPSLVPCDLGKFCSHELFLQLGWHC